MSASRLPLSQQAQAVRQRLHIRVLQLLACLVLITGLCHTLTAKADDNPYTMSYQAQNQGGLHSINTQVEPEIFMGKQREDDNISMLENGYDLMGFSGFESEEIAPELAVAQARKILADRVLVYVKKAGRPTPAATLEVIKEAARKGTALTEKDVAADPKKFIYYASYWAKLPPSILGVHVIKLIPKSDLAQDEKKDAKLESQGVRILAVIHGSAAEKAGVLRGDQLLKIQSENINDAANLSSVVRKLRGQTVTLLIKRGDQTLTIPTQL